MKTLASVLQNLQKIAPQSKRIAPQMKSLSCKTAPQREIISSLVCRHRQQLTLSLRDDGTHAACTKIRREYYDTIGDTTWQTLFLEMCQGGIKVFF